MKAKVFFTVIAVVAVVLGLSSCDGDKTTITRNDLSFTAVNLIDGEKKLSATTGAGSIVTVNWTVDISVNGETTTFSGTKRSNELPVRPGDEIELTFQPSCPEETEVFFTLPDGAMLKATASTPSVKWTIPSNFTSGMEIKGESRYETEDYFYIKSGKIVLIALE